MQELRVARTAATLAAAVVLSAGCSIHPLPDDLSRRTTYDIVEQIRCQARRAVEAYGYDYRTAAIAYEFSFQITEANNESAGLSAIVPFSKGGALSLVGGAGLNRERATIRNFKIVDSFDELRQVDCRDLTTEKNWLYPITGDIGVYEVVSTFIRLQKVSNPQAGDVFTFADTLKFTTNLNAGVQPRLVLLPVTDRLRLVEANADLNARRSDVHQVVVALSGGPLRSSRAPIGASLEMAGNSRLAVAGVAASGSSLLSTTVIQSNADPKDRALIELDRQRIIALQNRTVNLLVGP